MFISPWPLPFILVSVNIPSLTSDQGCSVQLPYVIELKETDLEGTEVLSIDSEPQIQWSYSLDESTDMYLSSYFNLTWINETQQVVFVLIKILDIEDINRTWNVSFNLIVLTLFCKENEDAGTVRYGVPISVITVNEFPPRFTVPTINIEVNEMVPVGQTLLHLIEWSVDDDLNPSEREIWSFSILQNETNIQNNAVAWIEVANPIDGVLKLKKSLDYEALPANNKVLTCTVIVMDTGGKTGSAVLKVIVLDEDDLPPVFRIPGCVAPCLAAYRATVSSEVTGIIANITNGPIQAIDGDALNYSMVYEIILGSDDINDYFQINSTNGSVRIVKELKDTKLDAVLLIIEASEVSTLKRSTRATLLMTVEYPPPPPEDNKLLLVVGAVAALLLILVACMVTCFCCNLFTRPVYIRGSLH